MGVSLEAADAQLCFGIDLGEEFEAPWDCEEYDYDIDRSKSWCKRNYGEKAPFEIVYHCACEYPMYILAVPGTVSTAYRGYPCVVDDLHVDPASAVKFYAAIEKCFGITGVNAKWLLSSYWG
jgi:hypothetical protein